jgi:fructose-1,6-bisphosphatase I
MDIKPEHIHQRIPFFGGSTTMVEKAESFIQEAEDDQTKKRIVL